MHWRRKWQPTPGFFPGESQGQGRLVDCSPWGREEPDMTERLPFPFPFVACGILVSWAGIKPVPPALKVQSLSHWTAREVPRVHASETIKFLTLSFCKQRMGSFAGPVVFTPLKSVFLTTHYIKDTIRDALLEREARPCRHWPRLACVQPLRWPGAFPGTLGLLENLDLKASIIDKLPKISGETLPAQGGGACLRQTVGQPCAPAGLPACCPPQANCLHMSVSAGLAALYEDRCAHRVEFKCE